MNRWTDLKIVCYTGLALLLVSWAAMAQTPDMVWSTLTASCENGNARNNCGTGTNAQAWRLASSAPLLVAAYRVNNANCATRWWDQNVSIQWTRPANLNASWCVAYKPQGSTNENLFKTAGSITWSSGTPVNCEVSSWSEWVAGEWGQCTGGQQSRSETRTRTVTTQPANGGAACPPLTESRVVTQQCALPAPTVLISVSASPVYTGTPVTVTWSSTNAASCSASWAASVPFNGSQSLTMLAPSENWVWVDCVNPYGGYRAQTGFVVISKTPDCYPNQERETDRDKVEVKAISLCQHDPAISGHGDLVLRDA